MKIAFALVVALLGWFESGPLAAQDAPQTAASVATKGKELMALEQKLLGKWQGGACVGNYTFKADGTFVLDHYTPGNNTLTGTWSIHWDALPPTLLICCKTSDFKTKVPTRTEYEYLNKALEFKLLELSDEKFIYGWTEGKLAFERPPTEK